MYKPKEKKQDVTQVQSSNQGKKQHGKMQRGETDDEHGIVHKRMKNHPSSGSKRRRKKREAGMRREASPAGGGDQSRSGERRQ